MMTIIHNTVLVVLALLCWAPVIYLHRRNTDLYRCYMDMVRQAWTASALRSAEEEGVRWRRHSRQLLVVGSFCAVVSMLLLHLVIIDLQPH